MHVVQLRPNLDDVPFATQLSNLNHVRPVYYWWYFGSCHISNRFIIICVILNRIGCECALRCECPSIIKFNFRKSLSILFDWILLPQTNDGRTHWTIIYFDTIYIHLNFGFAKAKLFGHRLQKISFADIARSSWQIHRYLHVSLHCLIFRKIHRVPNGFSISKWWIDKASPFRGAAKHFESNYRCSDRSGMSYEAFGIHRR